MGGAPHRHVDAVLAVPDLVEREARHGAEAEGPQRQRASAGRAARRRAAPSTPLEGGDERAEHGAAEDHDEPEQDAACAGR